MLPVSFVTGFVLASFGLGHSLIENTAVVFGVLLLGLFFCKDAFAGKSPGKALLGVRVIDTTTGQPADVMASFKRNLPLIIPFMPLIVAGRLCSGYRTGDKWAGTKVIWSKHAEHPIFAVNGNRQML